MKKSFLLLTSLAFALFSLVPSRPAHALVQASAAYSNFPGGLGVGKSSLGTYAYLTGVATVYHQIPLVSIFTGTNGTTALADTAITTSLYVGGATGLSNQAAVIFPVETDVAYASIPVLVPFNYQSNGGLLLALHTNVSFTAGSVSITADAYSQVFNGATVTAKQAGTTMQLATSAATQIITLSVASGLTLTPGSIVNFKVSKALTSLAARVQILGAWFSYRPGGVLNGQ